MFLRSVKRLKNEDSFFPDGADNVPDFLIIDQQIDELAHFKVINRNHRLTLTSEDEIFLLCSF